VATAQQDGLTLTVSLRSVNHRYFDLRVHMPESLLPLEREARSSWEPSDGMRALIAERDAARAARDYAASDRLRDELTALGVEVMDTAEGTRVRPRG